MLHGGPELFYHVGLWQLFQLLARGLVDVFLSRGFSHAGLIHFFLDASECRLVGFLLGIVFMHNLHDVTSPKGLQVNLGQDCQVSVLSSYRAVVNSPTNLRNVASQV